MINNQPNLTPFGFGETCVGQTVQEFDQDYKEQVAMCIEWLKTKVIDNKINRVSTSYGIKHIIERELKTYVANGCFIAAVIHLGIPYKRIPNSPNILVAISHKELYRNDPNLG
jgi:hypothetical protein